MSEYDSVAEIIHSQRNKLELVESSIKLIMMRKRDPKISYQLKQKSEDSERIQNKLSTIQQEKNRQISMCQNLKNLSSTLTKLQVRIEDTESRLKENGILSANQSLISRNESEVLEVSPSTTTYVAIDCTPKVTPITYSKCTKFIRKLEYKMSGIEPLTEEQYSSLPKYMVGRTTLDTINKFIEVINQAVLVKYQLLSKSKASLNGKDLHVYRNYKALETNETKGLYFVTESDLAKRQGTKNLVKQSYNLLTILRHSKRIYEDRSNKILKYVLL